MLLGRANKLRLFFFSLWNRHYLPKKSVQLPSANRRAASSRPAKLSAVSQVPPDRSSLDPRLDLNAGDRAAVTGVPVALDARVGGKFHASPGMRGRISIA